MSNTPPQLGRSLWQSSLSLVVFALVTAGLVASTALLTSERISDNRAQAAARLMHELLPEDQQYQLDLHHPLQLPAAPTLGQDQPFQAYLARSARDATQSALILPLIARDGYSGQIHLLIALNSQGEVLGVRVVEHQETPGLGDKIERQKSAWILSFNGRSLSNTSGWAVQRDGGEFDQFTGATITPRAVVRAVHRALIWQEQHSMLLDSALADWQAEAERRDQETSP
ncbi:electron transport complex subunit RsxG [Marinospirillum sp. MEB164]|uniref:Ion-translocating oxidoreductase complex subunit G n=1 Tax=Marinospirillum alkalitolerans TaxID=3123374 RepID=A0ABW8PZP1_9GAMM